MDARSKTETEVRVVYSGHVVAWFCFLYMIHAMNPPQRTISPFVFAAFAVAAACSIAVGARMRKKFLASTELFLTDPQKALSGWKLAHFIGFSCAMSVTIFGVALTFIGASWFVPGIFFAVSLGFLVLWRPHSNFGPS